ncbi:MAG: hypothetical protein WCH34_17075 [Bacteroidota bacterium]
MENLLYYHFWMLKDAEIPFDIEKEYCYLQEANDKKFIANYFVSREYLKYLFENNYFAELLTVYLNVSYDENHPEDIKSKAIDWISHTIEILLEADIFYNFINLKILEHIVKDFKPTNKINVLRLDENKIPQWMSLDRSDPFLKQIVVNISIGNPSSNIVVNVSEEKQENLDDEVEDRKLDKKNEFLKIQIFIIRELLKKLGVTINNQKVKDVNGLTAILTGGSIDTIAKYARGQISFTKKTHKEAVDRVNPILQNLNLGITLIISPDTKK